MPGTDWIITSGMIGAGSPCGRLFAVHRDDHSCSEISPYFLEFALDQARFGEQADLDPYNLAPHGIDVITRADGVLELYVVNHGGRESIEVFEILLHDRRPRLRWIGGVEFPGTAIGNDVAAVPGGGFVTTTTGHIDGSSPASRAELLSKVDTGGVLEWSRVDGWKLLPGTQMSVANGVALSKDGLWLYVTGTNSRNIKRVQRGPIDPEIHSVEIDILPDNLTWTASGQLLVAGTYGVDLLEFMAAHFGANPNMFLPSRILHIDPHSLEAFTAIEYTEPVYGAATVALEVGEQIWVGAARDQGIACFQPG
ncbi:MAG TPA: hypothetical protein VF503_20990 [Sphingobium sp.]|uniref:hypothetical protein n=1 Tax=Sphingobium sp. TaxID=1912891 RepID=UPI002ED02ADC